MDPKKWTTDPHAFCMENENFLFLLKMFHTIAADPQDEHM
jgi:hypothetical protein